MNRFLRFTLILATILTSSCLFQISAHATPKQMCHCVRLDAPLTAPSLRPREILNWSRDAAILSFQYDFTNMQDWMQEYAAYFSPYGWNHYYSALKHSGNLERVKDEKLAVNATPIEPPTVLWEGVDANVYKWGVQIPVLVQYRNDKMKVSQKLMVTMVLRRTNPPFGFQGMSIDQFVAKPFEPDADA